jgi:hypothetical protein
MSDPIQDIARQLGITTFGDGLLTKIRETIDLLQSDANNLMQYKEVAAELEAELATLKAQEPIGWYTDDHLTDKSATTYDRAIAERWDEKGWQLWPLYAAPALAKKELSDV